MKTWDDLSIKEKADIMGVAISNGITTLPEIKAKYNEFAEGGELSDEYYTDVEDTDANEYKSGGKIYIKPSHRGRFTELKKRTDHSATWFKQHGTPAQRKMATFALNAKHWKHGLGGNLFSGEEDYSSQMNSNLSTVPRRTVYKATKTGRVWNTEAEAAKDNYNYDNDIHYRYHIKAGNYKSPLVNYNIPFIPEKQITLTNAGLATGAILSTNLLDSIAVNAEKAGLPIKTGMGLATKESTLNNPTYDIKSRARISKSEREELNSAYEIAKANGTKLDLTPQQIIGTSDIPEGLLIMYNPDDNPYLSTSGYVFKKAKSWEENKKMLEESEKYADKLAEKNEKLPSKSYLQAGFEAYKKDPYAWNPGQPNYPQLVDKRGEEVWNSPEVQKWYREYQKNKKALGGNLFAPGGYIPTDKVKKRITQWEGAAMTGAIDPLSGKFLTNNSFEYEADAFTKALPENIREQVLSNQELADNLYSYSYNVGAGKFKERVVPALLKYFAGEGSPYEIANSMWASGDKKLRGLRNRRGVEKKGVIDSLISPYLVEPTNSIVVSNPFTDIQQPIPAPIMVPDENQYVSVHTQTQEDIDRQEQQRAIERLNNIERFNRLMNLINVQNNPTSTFVPQNAPYTVNSNAFGGNLFDGLTQPTQQMDKTYDVGFLPEVTVTAPKRWFVGYDENANPIYTTDYTQSQEYLQNQLPVGNTEQRRRQWAFENVGSNGQVRPGLHGDAADLAKAAQLGIGTALTPLAASTTIPSLSPIVNNPITSNPIWDAAWTTSAMVNLPEATQYGIENIKKGNYSKGLNALGLAGLDVVGAGQLLGRTGRMLSPTFRAKHAYNAIQPVGYEKPFKRLYDWAKDMWYDNPVDYANPKWYRDISEIDGVKVQRPKQGYTGTGSYLASDIENAGQIADEARIDAWALHNQLPQQYGTYKKVKDGVYTYDMDNIMKKSKGTWHPKHAPKEEKTAMSDFVTGAGGGLTDFRLVAKGGNNGIMHIEDVNDYHPFSRKMDKFTRKLFPGLTEKFFEWSVKPQIVDNYPKLSNWFYERSMNGLLPSVDRMMSDFEIGKITGGKPFKMATDIKYHTVPKIFNTPDGQQFALPSYKYGYDPYQVSYVKPIDNIRFNQLDLKQFINNIDNNIPVQIKNTTR
jgi:hypothetical protein